jgi:hypothetical protein
MDTKKMVWLGLFVGSTVGGLIGAAIDHGNGLGFWSFALGTIGSIIGVWAGYKLSTS